MNQNSTIPSCAFISKSNTLQRKLINEVTVEYNNVSTPAEALWDTGASGTCISKKIVETLELIPTGKQNIQTPSGTSTVNNYLISIVLPNRVRIKNVVVCDCEIGSQGIDMLIGMDIISLGDFCVSNFSNKTSFTFRTPSLKEINFVNELKMEALIGKKHGLGMKNKKSKKRKR